MNEIKIKLKPDIYTALKELSENDGFSNVEEYAGYIIEHVVKESTGSSHNKEDEEKIKERLKKLGYIE